MDYVVKMDGEKVRVFQGVDIKVVRRWAEMHCRGKVKIVRLEDCGRLPEACGRMYPCLDLNKLVYKPFLSVV